MNARSSKVEQERTENMNTTEIKFDLVGAIIAYESGELDEAGTQELMEYLVKTGIWRQLQGHYGRELAARGLI
jgi:hypothetical protein